MMKLCDAQELLVASSATTSVVSNDVNATKALAATL